MKPLFLFFLFVAGYAGARAQSILYAPESIPVKGSEGFEIVGKSAGYYIVSKQIGGAESVLFYDGELRQRQQVLLGLDKKRFRLIGFSVHATGVYALSTSSTRKYHYLYASFISNATFSAGPPRLLDSFPVLTGSNTRFHLIRSRNGEQIALYKVNRSFRQKALFLDIALIDAGRFTHRKRTLMFPSFAPQQNVEGVELADNGNFYFAVAGRPANGGYIRQLAFCTLAAGADTVQSTAVPVNDLYPDRVQLFINNRQQTCTLFSFGSFRSEGNIDGIFTASVDMTGKKPVQSHTYRFTDKERIEANKRISLDISFNDYYITDVVAKSGGGIIIIAECFYTASRETNVNRWQRPFPDGWSNTAATPLNFSEQAQQGSIAYGSIEPGTTPGLRTNTFPGENLFHAENLLLLNIDDGGITSSITFLNKRQQSNAASELSYAGLKRTDALLLFFNEWAPQSAPILKAVQVDASLEPVTLPVVKGLLPQYLLLNRMAVQVSNNELIIPSVFNNRFVFALLKY